MTESTLTRAVVKMIHQEFPGIWFYKACDRFRAGLPDLILNCTGIFCGIELKVGKNKPTKLQEYEIKQIIKYGGKAITCYSVDEVRQFLKGIYKEGGDRHGKGIR